MERRLLQIAVLVAALGPIWVGVGGVLWGAAAAGGYLAGPADSQFRYLSGLLIGVGAAYAVLAPRIEREGARLFMLTLIMVLAGFCRASAMLTAARPGEGVSVALVAELVVAPALYLWQTRLARRASMDASAARR